MSVASVLLLNFTSQAFASSQSFSDFFFLYQMSFIGSSGFVGLCFIVALAVVCMRRFVCFDTEEEERKPLAVKVQDHVDAAQWGVKNALQLLIGLAAFGLSAAAVLAPVVTFPDGTNFFYLGHCRGDVCQKWNSTFRQTCGYMTLTSQSGGGALPLAALLCAGGGGGLYVFIIVIELFRRSCPDLCLGYDPDGDLGNPSKGYFTRWFLLLLRILAFGAHITAITFMNIYIFVPVAVCVNGFFVWPDMITAGGSFGDGYYVLCVALVFDFIDIWLDGVLGEVGRFVIDQPEDEIALHELTPHVVTTLPSVIANKIDTSVKIDNSPHVVSPSQPQLSNPSNGAIDDDAKKLIQQQQIALDNMKKEMREQQQQFILTLQQQQQQQQQQQPTSPSFQVLAPSSPLSNSFSALPAQPQQNAGIESDKQQQQQQEKDRQHGEQLAEQQNQIIALQQLVQQLQVQNSSGNFSTAVMIDPPSPKKQAVDYYQALPQITTTQQDQNQDQNQNNNDTHNMKNPLSFAPQDVINDDADVYCDDMGCAEPESTDEEKKKTKSGKSGKTKQERNAAAVSRREKFDAQQRIMQQLQEQQDELIAKLQGAVSNGQN